MLRLENLRKKDNRIIADFYFPGTEDKGQIVYDIQNQRVVEAHCDECDYSTVYGRHHLERVLKMMAEHNKYPQTYEYFWY